MCACGCVCAYAVLVSRETPGPSARFLLTLKREELKWQVGLHGTEVQESSFPVHSRASHQARRPASD